MWITSKWVHNNLYLYFGGCLSHLAPPFYWGYCRGTYTLQEILGLLGPSDLWRSLYEFWPGHKCSLFRLLALLCFGKLWKERVGSYPTISLSFSAHAEKLVPAVLALSGSVPQRLPDWMNNLFGPFSSFLHLSRSRWYTLILSSISSLFSETSC